MIAKEDLINGALYLGVCRNAKQARWHADKNKFTYTRRKFGLSFDEDICHPDDDQIYDVFTPLEIITENQDD